MDNSYQLLDSGAGEKLERFGKFILRRPSSLCIWKKGKPELWSKADAIFEPKSERWTLSKELNTETQWQVEVLGVSLILRLQDNGQVGLFPEHASYLPTLLEGIQPAKVLNLFAFTGLATLVCRLRGAQVTHVDLSKKALGWAKSNLENQDREQQGLPEVRWICDDAVAFLRREVKRGNKYDLVIVDPPSFSRISKNDFWRIEDILPEIVENSRAVLNAENSGLALTCHDPGVSAPMLANLLLDSFTSGEVKPIELSIPESQSCRILPAGSCAVWKSN